MDDIKQIVNSSADWVLKMGIILVIFSTLFFFTNSFTEFFDTPKFLVLLSVTAAALVFLAVRFTLNGQVVWIRTPLDIPLLLLLAVGIVSILLSNSPFVSLLGNQGKIHGSLISIAVYILFYFILVQSLKGRKTIQLIMGVLGFLASLLAIITLLSFVGVKLLPSPWTHGPNFTPTGLSFSTAAVLTLLLPLMISSLLSAKPVIQIISATLLTLFGLNIALTGNLAVWIASLVGLTLTLVSHRIALSQFVKQFFSFASLRQINPIRLITLFSPAAVVILAVVLSLIPPIGGAQNPLYSQAKNFPRQSQLPLTTSWKISVSAFRDSPFWGSGPGTYLFNFTNYKPIEFNNTKNWNVRFDAPFNEYLRVLAELGGIGLVAMLSLTTLYISSAWKPLTAYFKPNIGGAELLSESRLRGDLAVSGLLFFIMLALHTSTLTVWVVGLLILAAVMILNLSLGAGKSWDMEASIKDTVLKIASHVSSTHPSQETIKAAALPSVLLTVCLGLMLFAYFYGGKFALADYHHRIALNAIAQNQGIVAYNELVAAEKLNPLSDLYRIDLAQLNFSLANAIAQAKGPTEASPSGSLSDQDKQNIQVLLQQSITEGRTATTLNPKSALNWEILGLLYRQIAGVAQNALVFSLDAYGRAISQDPLNPNLRLSVGGVYYAIKNYDLAIRFFTDSINLKPDFANGYYNLSVALKDKGDLATAQTVAEKVLTLVDKDSQDYKIVSDYLTDLKGKRESEVKPPASQTSGALQKEELPKVVDVGKPPKNIATPSAVKKPDATPKPSPTP